MRVQLLLFSLLSLLIVENFAQVVISTQGNSTSNSDGSLDYTIGEVVITFGTDGLIDLTQGFHQPILKLTTIQDLQVDLLLEIYPNPATEQLNIQLENFEPGYSFQLYDALGKLLLTEPLLSSNKVIPFNSYSTGLYFLVFVKGKNEKLKTFKIQKSH